MSKLKEKLTEVSENMLTDLSEKPIKTIFWAVLIVYIVIRIFKSLSND